MVRIFVKYSIIFWGPKDNLSKPFVCLLREDLTEWLNENITKFFDFNYFYETLDRKSGEFGRKNFSNMQIIKPYIDFESVSDAVLFKLCWM